MADIWYVNLHLYGYQTNTNTHILAFRSTETYMVPGLVATNPTRDHSMLMLTSRLIRSRPLCEARARQELVKFGVKEESLGHFASEVYDYSAEMVSLFGDTGFELLATLEFVTDATVESGINGYDCLPDYICDITELHNDDGSALSDAEVEERILEALSRPGSNTGVAMTVITKLRRIGKVSPWDVPGACSLCSDDFLPASEVLKLPCGHRFHDPCIVKYLQRKKTCPACGILISH